MPANLLFWAITLLACQACFGRSESGPAFLPELSGREVAEVRQSIALLKTSERGPYLRLRWFCNDGSIHPPAGNPCRQRGGGRQHAELNEAALRLAQMRFHVGTILAGTSFDSLFDAAGDNTRLKELVIQQFLFETDDGWILRQARHYRGARQIEDEERSGERILQQLLSDPGWVSRNFLLASQLVSVIPHPGRASSSSSEVRNLAADIARLEPGFSRLRAQLHAFPSPADPAAVRAYLEQNQPDEPVKGKLETLLAALDHLYSGARFPDLVRQSEALLAELPQRGELRGLLKNLTAAKAHEGALPTEELEVLAGILRTLRETVESTSDGRINLQLLDLANLLAERAIVVSRNTGPDDSRLARLSTLDSWFSLAYGMGFLSSRELTSLRTELANFLAGSHRPAVREYKAVLNYLGRSLDWALGTSRQTFGPLHQRYVLVEEAARGFLDAQLRASVVFPLARSLTDLQEDADHLLGNGEMPTGLSLRAMSPGLAVGPLRILEEIPAAWEPEPASIYVIPEIVSELRPVAGLLSVGAGSLLSHVQLLARALQIPNASVTVAEVERLRKLEGKEVLLAVSPMGVVILKEPSELKGAERGLLDFARRKKAPPTLLDSSKLRLDQWLPLSLYDLRSSDSGVLAGPKAANLGQLHALFPGSVPKGIVLPFGMYHRHVNRAYDSRSPLLDEIRSTFQKAGFLRMNGSGEATVNAFVFPNLARFRSAIEKMPWISEDRVRIVKALRDTFGPNLNQGVFVRSDTNVEDLPDFSGAGLNLTVPNQKSAESVLAAVKLLWASPFSERSFLWRSRVLAEQTDIFPSVLILESIPSEKSGVLVTTSLEARDCPDCLTIATAEGVGGVVQGEAAEVIVVAPDGSVRLLSQDKSPFCQFLDSSGQGGVIVRPSSRQDTLLSSQEISQLKAVGEKLRSSMPGNPGTLWDLEFGFSNGTFWLFQVRPFIPYQGHAGLPVLSAIDRTLGPGAASRLDLQARPGSGRNLTE